MKILYAALLFLLIAAPILYFTFESLAPARSRASDAAGSDRESERRKGAFWLGASVGAGYVLLGDALVTGLLRPLQ